MPITKKLKATKTIHTDTKKVVKEVAEVAVVEEAAFKEAEAVQDPKPSMLIVKIALMVSANHYTKRRELRIKITKK